MILKKVIENDKEIYVPISFEEAVKIHDKTQLVFSSEDEEDEFEEYLDELEEAEEEEEEDDDDENEDDDDDDKFFDINNLFSKSNIIALLPFLSREKLSKIVDGYINKDPKYSKINIVCVFPFLGREELDRLFKTFVNNEELNDMVTKIVPFVSSSTINEFVDEYVEG